MRAGSIRFFLGGEERRARDRLPTYLSELAPTIIPPAIAMATPAANPTGADGPSPFEGPRRLVSAGRLDRLAREGSARRVEDCRRRCRECAGNGPRGMRGVDAHFA